ncbi:bifunctional 2-polyprenyl-6-hydroxyphenol methylase/3-demethylubiquinol 3-O-methyltransferase UbiG [Paenibacillus sp. J2TS4]|uniref:class I SAM-dependent methyltransferase n=1 Tax=Paenibacillus sp. J2TS4 TaxID=2807194 RepID=UPI001B26E153|nr:class I SAM-dependent methyltransferase [Paenibacillus sp. J2TS4]GIP34649.1 methyltransferase [Paenibacillus sp. J2TS4]
MKKYYYEEHETTYQKIKRNHLMAWDQFHDPEKYNFDHFMMRPFLEKALDLINVNPAETKVFEYGCGTGAGACFLAARGFVVDAIDISPTAIELAKKIAIDRNLTINYCKQDLLELTSLQEEYDLVLDNYCLQSIVTDEDRSKLFTVIQTGLKDSGYYILASAMYNDKRSYDGDTYYDQDTGMVYDRISSPEQYDEAVQIHNEWWIPNRRHLKKEALREELTRNGFNILFQEDGNIICRKK